MSNDLTFITNEGNVKLKDRFATLIKDAKYFDVLVGYFYLSGFNLLYKSLETTEKIRILIGMGIDEKIEKVICKAKKSFYSESEAKQDIMNLLKKEICNLVNNKSQEEAINRFIEWLSTGKIEMRLYPDKNMHAKLYIVTFKEDDRDLGRVITGSSNFTYSGLIENMEFNVELKSRADYEFAKEKFNELWNSSIDIRDEFINTINEKTWFKRDITLYELYLKTLYEYFKEDLESLDETDYSYFNNGIKQLEFQKQAVINAIKILNDYGGVFLSDVVGLGKTYITAMILKQLDGKNLIIAPPNLIDIKNPGSWTNVLNQFNTKADYVSIGNLNEAFIRGIDDYKNIVVDEAHRFRNSETERYLKLAEICRGKRVILVTATPYNNTPMDILNLVSLFQSPRSSSIPGIPDLYSFFKMIDNRLSNIDRQKEYKKYLEITRDNAKEIREKVLKYIMIRRTRAEIERYFSEDLKKNNIKFPNINKPIALYYEFNDEEDEIFNETIKIITKEIKYARYTPLLYLNKKVNQLEIQSQKNLGSFMKILLVKRLESSFYAFRKTIERFIISYEKFIKEYKNGNVYISKKYANKIIDLLDNDEDEKIQEYIDEGSARRYNSSDFQDRFLNDKENDLNLFIKIRNMWMKIKRDPKLDKLKNEIKNNDLLKNKIIIFTESKETAEYLKQNLSNNLKGGVLLFTGEQSDKIKEKVIENFDDGADCKKDYYRILVSTEVLSEGVNLHRSNIVINYDLPWNPIRMIQRVGRVNRIGTKFDSIYIFNFFPTKQANNEIKLKELACAKLETFLTLLGEDAAILTEGETINSFELFNKLVSDDIFKQEFDNEESELKYLKVIRDVKEKDFQLYKKIKNLPLNLRLAKSSGNSMNMNGLISFLKFKNMKKFYITDNKNNTKELDFLSAIKLIEVKDGDELEKIPDNIYEFIELNKNELSNLYKITNRLTKSEFKLIKHIKACKNISKLKEEDREFLNRLEYRIFRGDIPNKVINTVLKELEITKDPINCIKNNISIRFLQDHFREIRKDDELIDEVVLSLFIK